MFLRSQLVALMLALVGCWHAPAPAPAAPIARAPALPPPPTLAIETTLPGRLVFDRNGRPWQVTCTRIDPTQRDGVLAIRPWEGGTFEPAGPCDDIDVDARYVQSYEDTIAIDGSRVALASYGQHLVTVRERGAIQQTIAWSGYINVHGIAFDGDALLLVVDRFDAQKPAAIAGVSLEKALAAIVRIERSGRATMRSLVDYLSTGAGFAPQLVVAGRDHMLLVGAAGGLRTCRYDLVCGEIKHAPRAERALPLDDGGALTLEFERHVTRIAPDGTVAWTHKSRPWALLGASATEVWFTELGETNQYVDVLAVDRATGKPGYRDRAKISRSERDPIGNYLAISAIAQTPIGSVIRGEFGGLLTSGPAKLETKTLGAMCWWENPHDGNRYTIPLDGECDRRHAKAILTERAIFVATNAPSLRQRLYPPRTD